MSFLNKGYSGKAWLITRRYIKPLCWFLYVTRGRTRATQGHKRHACHTKLCVKELCVTKLCVWESCMWGNCAKELRVTKLYVTKLCMKELCVKDCVVRESAESETERTTGYRTKKLEPHATDSGEQWWLNQLVQLFNVGVSENVVYP